MLFNPFSQFEVYPLVKFSIAGQDLSFTNASLFMIIALLCVSCFLYFATREKALIPTKIQSSAELLFLFINNTLTSSAGHKSQPFFSFVFTLFMFIAALNLCGMLPYGFTVTSHFIVTMALAALVFLVVTITGFVKHGLHFFSLFLPQGTPLWLAPVLFIIEFISFLSRPISLSIRLAGNMIAGHVLLKVLASFVLVMGIGGILPALLMMIVVGFEFCVAIFQAYIFTILTCVYLNDALNLH